MTTTAHPHLHHRLHLTRSARRHATLGTARHAAVASPRRAGLRTGVLLQDLLRAMRRLGATIAPHPEAVPLLTTIAVTFLVAVAFIGLTATGTLSAGVA